MPTNERDLEELKKDAYQAGKNFALALKEVTEGTHRADGAFKALLEAWHAGMASEGQ